MNFTMLDAHQVLKAAFSDATTSLKTSEGFLSSSVGNKILIAYPSDTTETYTFKSGDTVLYVITITYTNDTKTNLSSVERTT